MKNNNSIETVLQTNVRMIADKYNIELIFDGSSPCTNGQQIFVPTLPADLDEETLTEINGYVDHEVAHCKYTDFPYLLRKGYINPLHQQMFNMAEDSRIEVKLTAEFPGTQTHLDFINSKWGKINSDKWDELPAGFRIINNVRWIMEDQPLRLDADIRPAFSRRVKALCFMLRLADSTKDVHTMTRQIVEEMIKALQENQNNDEQQQQQQQQEEQKQEEQDSGDDEQNNKESADEGEESDSDEAGESDDEQDGDGAKGKQEDQDGDDGEESGDSEESGDEEGEESEGEGSGSGEGEESDEDGEESSSKGSGSSAGDGEESDEDDDSSKGDSDGDGEESDSDEDGEPSHGQAKPTDSRNSKGGGYGTQDAVTPEELTSEEHFKTDLPTDIHSYIEQVIHELLNRVADENEKIFEFELPEGEIASVGRHIPSTTKFDTVEDYTRFRHPAYAKLAAKVRPLVTKVSTEIEQILSVEENDRWVSEREEGRFNTGCINRIVTNPGYNTIFKEKLIDDVRDVALMFLVDHSGSMGGPKIVVAQETTVVLAETARALGLPFEVGGYTTQGEEIPGGPAHNRLEALRHIIYKTFDTDNLEGLSLMSAQNNNIDGESVRFFAERLLQHKAKRKIMFVLSDGYPAGYCRSNALLNKDLKDAVQEMERLGVEVVAFGIRSESVSRFYPKHVVVNDIEQLPKIVAKELKKILTEDFN